MRINFFEELDAIKHNMSGVTSSFNNAKKILKANNISFVVNADLNGKDICHFETLGLSNLFTLLKCNQPKVVSVHAIPEEMQAYAFSDLTIPLAHRYFNFFYNKADLLIVPTLFTMRRIEEMSITTPVKLISNGVEVKKYKFSLSKRKKFRKKYGFSKEDVIIYTVGFVMIRKGLETFIKIARKFPEYKFVWAGKFTFEGTKVPVFLENEYKKVREMVKNPPSNALFTGFVPDINDVHSGCDIFLFPSYAENEGISILEACSAKRPVIVRNIGTYDSWLYHGRNAMKFTSIKDLEGIINKLAKDKKYRNKLASKGYEVAVKRDIKKTGKELIKAYKSVLNKNHK